MDKIIGNNIRSLRNKTQLTQQELADFLGISRVEMNYYENGNRSMPSSLISKAAQLFSIDEIDLYQDDPALLEINMAFAFRAGSLEVNDLDSIASFKKIAMNYLKMQTALNK